MIPDNGDYLKMEVLFEFMRVGNVIRVVAIDPVTRTEVVMVGSPKYSRELLKRMAARKLVYVLEKKAGRGPGVNR